MSEDLKSEVLKPAAESGIPIELLPTAFRGPVCDGATVNPLTPVPVVSLP